MANQDLVKTESIGGLMRGILEDLRTLIREEIALARVELREQAGRARLAALSFGVMAGALLFGTLFLLIAAAMGVAAMLGQLNWVGFLIVALLLMGVGLVAFASGRKQLRRVHGVPQETVSTMKENAAWIAMRLSSDRK